jgi:GTP-binding protein
VIRVRGARFITAVSQPGRYPNTSSRPATPPPELVFAGRSNVGKSTLINILTGRRGLARSSKTPGRTRELHFYAIDTSRGLVVFVDFPGYGYARVSKVQRAAWGPLAERYLEDRDCLRAVVLIVDVRRGLEREEDDLLAYLDSHERPAIVAVTKIDKLASSKQRAAVQKIQQAVGDVPVVGVSGRTGAGRVELWRALEEAAFGGAGLSP